MRRRTVFSCSSCGDPRVRRGRHLELDPRRGAERGEPGAGVDDRQQPSVGERDDDRQPRLGVAAELLDRPPRVGEPVEAGKQDDRVEIVGERPLEPLMRVAAFERDALTAAELGPGALDRRLVVVDAGDRGRALGEDRRPGAALAAELEHPLARAELRGDAVAVRRRQREYRRVAHPLGAQALDGVHDTSASLACARSSPSNRSRPGIATARSIEPRRTR